MCTHDVQFHDIKNKKMSLNICFFFFCFCFALLEEFHRV